MGAWTLYGLGTENESLPGFITLSPSSNNGGPINYGSSFLPAIYQGNAHRLQRSIHRRCQGQQHLQSIAIDPVQRLQLDFLKSLNQTSLERDSDSPGVEGMIESYELAFRMQGAMPALMDISNETKATKQQYGVDETGTDNFGRQCLLARALPKRECGLSKLPTAAGISTAI